MSHKGPSLRVDEGRASGEASKEEQGHQKPQEASGPSSCQPTRSLGTDRTTHIEKADYIQQPRKHTFSSLIPFTLTSTQNGLKFIRTKHNDGNFIWLVCQDLSKFLVSTPCTQPSHLPHYLELALFLLEIQKKLINLLVTRTHYRGIWCSQYVGYDSVTNYSNFYLILTLELK